FIDFCFFFQAEDGIRDFHVTGVQTCALPIYVEDPKRLVANYGLPFEFWMQLGVGFTIFTISAWIWAMRPRALANRLFGITGIGRSEERRVGKECRCR